MMFFVEYVLPFVVALTVLVFIHELGHYFPARRNGVKVEVFSIGFGPELFGFFDKHGTRWKFSVIPLGGYVRMFGDADAASRPDHEASSKMNAKDYALTHQSKTVWQRMAISFGGPLANLLFAVVAMAILFLVKGHPVLPSTVQEVRPDSVAMQLGIKANDRITEFNGTKVATFKELRAAIAAFEGHDLKVTVERDNEPVVLSLKKTETFAKPFVLGVVPGAPEFEKRGAIDSVISAFTTTYEMSRDVVVTISETVIGKRKGGELGGILSIGEMAGKSAQSSAASFIWFLALLSINLGMLNLFPLPMLDGGHILFYIIEAVRGRPVPVKAQEYTFLAGFIIVVSLMLFVTWNDLSRLKVFESLGQILHLTSK